MSFEKIHLNTSNEIRNSKVAPKSKLLKQIRVILGLAKIEGYDDSGRIRGEKGIFLPNSDIVSLLNNAMTPGRVLIGQDIFISLLKEAKIPPELIVNDNVRAKLVGLTHSIPAPPIPEPQIRIETAVHKSPIKRKIDNEEPTNPKVQRTEPPLLEREDLRPILKRSRDESPPRLEPQIAYKRPRTIQQWDLLD